VTHLIIKAKVEGSAKALSREKEKVQKVIATEAGNFTGIRFCQAVMRIGPGKTKLKCQGKEAP